MEIIARPCIFWSDVQTLSERRHCKDIMDRFNSYIIEKDKFIVEFSIPLSADGCKELISEIQQIENQYETNNKECYLGLQLPLKKYTKKDYLNAVAYQIVWGSFVSGYENMNVQGVFWDYCCGNPTWYDGGECGFQIGNYRMSYNQLKNKKYAITDVYDYVVNDELKHRLLELGAIENDFYPVLSKEDEITCWQLRPENILHGMAAVNQWKKIDGCIHCKKETYISNEYDHEWMNQTTFNQLKPLNKTEETFGRRFHPEIIVNKDVYIALKKECPRMQFEPIFLKE